ncbi:hypothetical protein LBMAG42_55750 [Deltaproteobacteria bacterium]|nr:hypothetical protein LBMAG42_55750 [Deltaproteobacteria bacterium]
MTLFTGLAVFGIIQAYPRAWLASDGDPGGRRTLPGRPPQRDLTRVGGEEQRQLRHALPACEQRETSADPLPDLLGVTALPLFPDLDAGLPLWMKAFLHQVLHLRLADMHHAVLAGPRPRNGSDAPRPRA